MSERWLWTQKEDIGPSPRYGHAMAYEPAHQRVVLFGGYGASGLFNDTWGWDGVAWTQLADMGPPARSYHAMAYDESRHRLVLFGGFAPPPYATRGSGTAQNGLRWPTLDLLRDRAVLSPTIRFASEWCSSVAGTVL